MARDRTGGNHLSSIQALDDAESLLDKEREDVIGFIRYVQRHSDDERVQTVLDGLCDDIADCRHLEPAYQR